MERFPAQPSHLDSEDEETLAVVGAIVESWDTARTIPGKVEDKLYWIGNTLERIMDSDKTDAEPYIDELNMDMEQIEEFVGSESDFAKLCDERVAYWREVRGKFIEQL